MAMFKLFRSIKPGMEYGFYFESSTPLTPVEVDKIHWLVAETFEPGYTSEESGSLAGFPNIFEIGPRMSVETPFSSNAVAICHAIGIGAIKRVERTLRIGTVLEWPEAMAMIGMDPLTQERWVEQFSGFNTDAQPAPVREIDLLGGGEDALARENKDLGLGMDRWDISFYTEMFRKMGRNPTDVELFQIGNANSEHCRHWYFRGRQVIDGKEMEHSLFELIRAPLRMRNPSNAILAFRDNAGVIHGAAVPVLIPEHPSASSRMVSKDTLLHITATAETHNHPTMIAPYPGAATGAGGRIRDNMAPGRGAFLGAGVAGYFVGNLHLSALPIPGEQKGEAPSPHASALHILLDGIQGVHSYGNQIGEPLIGGFTRTFGQRVNGERREPLKPVLYSGGLGFIPDESKEKQHPEPGMFVVAIGGPAYRIGVGGGSASSIADGSNTQELNLKSVQRGDAEMANRVNRVIRACVEMGKKNPIISIHDQGAGGPSNVLTELLETVGGNIDIRQIIVGDVTMSVLEIWSAEFQERYGLLIHPERLPRFRSLCKRERVNCEIVGEVTGDGYVTVVDSESHTTPVCLNLADILGELPAKTWTSEHLPRSFEPLQLPEGLTIGNALERVFRLPNVGSKGYIVHTVDRSVTGLVAQQQCCGPAQIAIGDVGVIAASFESDAGAAVSLGEQPIKMLIDPAAGARMALGEALTNMAGVRVSAFSEIELRVNWMWAAKKPGEGALLADAAVALSEACTSLGVVPNGGKDSLSMTVEAGGETVKSPGELVIFAHAQVPDVTRTVTPDFKQPGQSHIGFIDLGCGKNRLGGSSLAQAFGQIGDDPPDMDSPALLERAFKAIQLLIDKGLILALHDRSDGGLITTIIEMCMASHCGAGISVGDGPDILARLFSEELGWVFEYMVDREDDIGRIFADANVPFQRLGATMKAQAFVLLNATGVETIYSERLATLRLWWESTSLALDAARKDSVPETVEEERRSHGRLVAPDYYLSFWPSPTSRQSLEAPDKPHVAILREEGTNGDREMAAAFRAAGFDAFDVSMKDLIAGRASLDTFRGVAFCGGFSFMDTFDSAKGWAGVIRFNTQVREMFERFYARPDTFSLGVCNGCQLMAMLGWTLWPGLAPEEQPRFVHNFSGKFESRWTQVKILDSQSIFFRGMVGSTFGVHVAHGEGQLHLPNTSFMTEIRKYGLAPLAYVDPMGVQTDEYPYNPNGSPEGFAGLCSTNGRHLALMPHPERAFLMRQWHWQPENWRGLKASPWLQMFQNVRKWCDDVPSPTGA